MLLGRITCTIVSQSGALGIQLDGLWPEKHPIVGIWQCPSLTFHPLSIQKARNSSRKGWAKKGEGRSVFLLDLIYTHPGLTCCHWDLVGKRSSAEQPLRGQPQTLSVICSGYVECYLLSDQLASCMFLIVNNQRFQSHQSNMCNIQQAEVPNVLAFLSCCSNRSYQIGTESTDSLCISPCRYGNDMVYKGYFKDNVRQGFGILENHSAEHPFKYTGQWENDKKNGYGVWEDKDR